MATVRLTADTEHASLGRRADRLSRNRATWCRCLASKGPDTQLSIMSAVRTPRPRGWPVVRQFSAGHEAEASCLPQASLVRVSRLGARCPADARGPVTAEGRRGHGGP